MYDDYLLKKSQERFHVVYGYKLQMFTCGHKQMERAE